MPSPSRFSPCPRPRRPRTRPARPTLRGFTLVEVAVTSSLAAVLAALAWPSVHHLLEQRALEGAATALGADLHYARAQAVARQDTVRVSVLPAAAGGSCYLVHTGLADGCTCATGCDDAHRLLRRVLLPGRGPVHLTGPGASLQFDPELGTVTPTGTFALVSATGRAIHQVVNVMGRVRSCSPQAQVAGHAAC